MKLPTLLQIAALAAVVAGLVTNLVMPLALWLARAFSALDRPDGERKRHAAAVPRLGGVAVTAGLAFGAVVPLAFHWERWRAVVPRGELVAFALALAIVFLVGLVDDLHGLGPLKKLAGETVAAILLVQAGWSFSFFWLPVCGQIHFGAFGGLISVLWLVGVTNAVNLLDGLDGLAAGIVAIIAGSLATYSIWVGNAGSVALLAAMTGACLGFLRHNWEPARIFLGDSGSLVLGFLLAAISLHATFKAEATVAILLPLLALGLPVVDTLLVMAVRFLESSGRSLPARFRRMVEGDRQHLHHLLGHLIPRRRQIVLGLWGVAAIFCVMALVVVTEGEPELGLVLVAVQVVAIFLLRRLGFARAARRLAAAERAELRERLAPGPREP
ncbi:MAG TPA: MraY family glycosyltransferase [Thermoanaerobaculia bacterium]|jgi:UDP-GlcNAc:undecaprenyl-phosphate GlcNAc-1-phosphate transferase|nr:MraY family glycosyltransferase [Thermoanaerobaculia bacterium]HQN39723.1 MraY family glycosyltransferase [Thermoanaerobaculia bacterium]